MANEQQEKKMPFLPEETMRIQRVGVYLNDLKDRLHGLRQQHDEVILHSVEIIKEINDVSSTLCISNPMAPENRESLTKIKRLIQEFENLHPSRINTSVTLPVERGRVEIKKLLENFEKLNESHVLRESLLYFKRAKESFEKIDDYLEKLSSSGPTGSGVDAAKCIAGHSSDSGNSNTALCSNQLDKKSGLANVPSIRDKINMFNNVGESQFSSCCSSATSLDAYHSAQDLKGQPDSANANYQSGYEGDVDSEIDVTRIEGAASLLGLSD